ncbi:MAG: ketohydroxyglutarate aldolase [Chloroflexota bacterium]|nr:ketohydroxyglutarate aldolase [Chloroflexota bacterium]
METAKVNVAIAKDHEFSEVVEQAEAVGLTVEQSLDGLGLVSGSIEVGKLADLDQVPGVAAVDLEREYQLPPQGSTAQ